jgi:hypothetical protein
MTWSATGTLLIFCFWHTLLLALVTVVPTGAVMLQPRAVGVAGLDARWTLGLGGPDALYSALAWLVVGLLAVPWALIVRRLGRATLEQYRDLLGADRFVEGVIERVECRGAGLRRRYLVHVAGSAWLIAMGVAGHLRPGRPVRLRVTRFNHLVLDIAVPAEVPA